MILQSRTIHIIHTGPDSASAAKTLDALGCSSPAWLPEQVLDKFSLRLETNSYQVPSEQIQNARTVVALQKSLRHHLLESSTRLLGRIGHSCGRPAVRPQKHAELCHLHQLFFGKILVLCIKGGNWPSRLRLRLEASGLLGWDGTFSNRTLKSSAYNMIYSLYTCLPF